MISEREQLVTILGHNGQLAGFAFYRQIFDPRIADYDDANPRIGRIERIGDFTRASNEYSKNLNFEYDTVNHSILEFEYEVNEHEQNEKLQFFHVSKCWHVKSCQKFTDFTSLHYQP